MFFSVSKISYTFDNYFKIYQISILEFTKMLCFCLQKKQMIFFFKKRKGEDPSIKQK